VDEINDSKERVDGKKKLIIKDEPLMAKY